MGMLALGTSTVGWRSLRGASGATSATMTALPRMQLWWRARCWAMTVGLPCASHRPIRAPKARSDTSGVAHRGTIPRSTARGLSECTAKTTNRHCGDTPSPGPSTIWHPTRYEIPQYVPAPMCCSCRTSTEGGIEEPSSQHAVWHASLFKSECTVLLPERSMIACHA